MCYKEEVLNRNSNEKKSNSLLRLLLAKILVIVFFKLNFKKFSISSVKGRCKSIYEFMEHDIWSLPTIFFFFAFDGEYTCTICSFKRLYSFESKHIFLKQKISLEMSDAMFHNSAICMIIFSGLLDG